jgi:hypothetical protein
VTAVPPPARSIAGLPLPTAVFCAVLCAAAFCVYPILWPRAPVLDGDSPQYIEVAQDLADFRLDASHDRTVGYPLLLLLTESSHEPTRTLFFVSLLFHIASVWLLAVLLHSAGVNPRWLLVFCSVLFLPPYVEPAAVVMTENLAQFTLVVGLACLALWLPRRRAWLLGLSGLAFGLGALTRPVNQLLPLTVSACVLIIAVFRKSALTCKHALMAGAILLAASLLVMGSIAYVNKIKFDYFGLTSSLGFHLSTKTMAFVERLPDEYSVVREILVQARDAELVKRGGSHTGTQTIWRARQDLAAATGLTNTDLSRYLLQMNLSLIRRAPLEYLQEVARSAAVYWFPPAGPLANLHSRILRILWTLVHLVVVSAFWLQLVVFAGVTIFETTSELFARNARPKVFELRAILTQISPYFLAGSIVFYTMLLSCVLDIGEVRQRRATDVLIVFMCFLGAHIWRQAISAAERTAAT